MPMIGGDLAAMDGLARRFDVAGSEFRAESQALVRPGGRGPRGLHGRAAPASRPPPARWTTTSAGRSPGCARARRRHRVDGCPPPAAGAGIGGDGAGHRRPSRSSIAELLGRVRRASSNGALAARLGDMQRQVATAGERAERRWRRRSARAVARQREAFDLVMNG